MRLLFFGFRGILMKQTLKYDTGLPSYSSMIPYKINHPTAEKSHQKVYNRRKSIAGADEHGCETISK